MKKRFTVHFGLRLTQDERDALAKIAEQAGLSQAGALRRLIRLAVLEHDDQDQRGQMVSDKSKWSI